MSEPKFTQGPYVPEPRTYSSHDLPTASWKTTVRGAGGEYVASVYGESEEHSQLQAHFFAAAPEMYKALKAYESLDDFHANCEECSGDSVPPELCVACFPYADRARLLMRAAIAKAEGRSL